MHKDGRPLTMQVTILLRPSPSGEWCCEVEQDVSKTVGLPYASTTNSPLRVANVASDLSTRTETTKK